MATLTDEDRQARREADREKARTAVEALRSTEGWKRWLSCRRHFHRYSLANQLLIALQKPDATRVAGFRAWLKLGYCVRRGERALRIWVPIPPSKRALEEWKAGGEDATERPQMRFKLGPVFDRSQVEQLPPPAEPVPLDPPIAPVEGEDLAWAFPPLVELAGRIGAAVVLEPLSADVGGYFDPQSQRIGINAATWINQQVKTLVHELGHALLRADGEKPSFSYAEEELVVESIAFTVCGSMGLDASSYSVPYLTSWAEEAELETIQAAAGTIDRIAKRIEDELENTEHGFMAMA